MSKFVLAADLGGTNLRMSVVDREGTFLHSRRTATPRSDSYHEVVDAVVRLANECRESIGEGNTISAFGLAAAALVNSGSGTIISAPNLPELNGSKIVREIEERLGIRTILVNDANAAAVGEHWKGASRAVDSSICVTLGTGVGGGIILNGLPWIGIDGTAGEVGHINVEPNGVECGCGSHGCLEQYASANALTRMVGELAAEYPDSILANARDLTALQIFEAGKVNDELAVEVFRRMGTYLGIALADLVNVLNPEAIVLGGGAAAGWDLFIDHVRSQITERAFQQPAERVRLVRAELGDAAGMYGAAWSAFNVKAEAFQQS
jgi:glucokinase